MQINYIAPLSIATERAMTLLHYRTLRRHCYRACYIALLLTDFRFQKTMLRRDNCYRALRATAIFKNALTLISYFCAPAVLKNACATYE